MRRNPSKIGWPTLRTSATRFEESRTQQAAPHLSVVIPVFNEAEILQALFARLLPVLESCEETFEVLFVNDGSTDGSARILDEASTRSPHVACIHLQPNRGQHQAILEGFRLARGEWIITLDADLQNPPEEIPKLLEAFRHGHDVIGTYRVGRQDPWARRFASRSINTMLQRVWGITFRDMGCMLRGYTRAIAAEVAREPRRDVFIPAAGLLHARNPIEIPVEHAERHAGTSKYGVRQLIKLSRSVTRTLRNGRTRQGAAHAE